MKILKKYIESYVRSKNKKYFEKGLRKKSNRLKVIMSKGEEYIVK